jgi:hypothetical protein
MKNSDNEQVLTGSGEENANRSVEAADKSGQVQP